MIHVQLKQAETELRYQFTVIKNLENLVIFGKYKPVAYTIFLITGCYILVLFLTSSKSLIVFKGVAFMLLCLGWIAFIVYSIWLFWKVNQRNRRIEAIIKAKSRETKSYFISFDDENLIIETNEFQSKLSWRYFKSCFETTRAIFLFPEGTIYDFYSISLNEIGEQHYHDLRKIVKQNVSIKEIDAYVRKKANVI